MKKQNNLRLIKIALSLFACRSFNALGVILFILITSLPTIAQGGLYTWGSNGSGQLGNGTTTNQYTPTFINGDFSDLISLAGGESHSIALRSNKTVLAWGSNSYGQLGNGTTSNIPTLTPQPVPNLTNVIKIASKGYSNLALKSDGTVWIWGAGILSPTQVPNLTSIINIKTGFNHWLALDSSGRVWAWGDNYWGQIGNGSTMSVPEPILLTSPDLHDIIDIAAGYNHSQAVRNDGTVWGWGSNSLGQVGNGRGGRNYNSQLRVLSPEQVVNLSNVTQITAGNSFSIALKLDGTVWAWGYSEGDQLGHPRGNYEPPLNCGGVSIPQCETLPVQTAINNVTAISSGEEYTLARKRDGTLWVWGDNNYGEAGTGGIGKSLSNPIRQGLIRSVPVFGTGRNHGLFSLPNIPVPVGDNVTVNLGEATVKFEAVNTPGSVYITPEDALASSLGPITPPPGLRLYPNIQGYYFGFQFPTTQAYSGNITVCLKVPAVISPQNFSQLRIVLFSTELPTIRDYNNREICSVTSTPPNLLFFALPIVNETTISGRAATRINKPVKGAIVRLVSSSGETRTAITNAFGYYRFTGIMVGDTYLATVKDKRYRFKAATIDLDDEVTGLDFTALP